MKQIFVISLKLLDKNFGNWIGIKERNLFLWNMTKLQETKISDKIWSPSEIWSLLYSPISRVLPGAQQEEENISLNFLYHTCHALLQFCKCMRANTNAF